MLKYALCAAVIASFALVMHFWMVGLVFQQQIGCRLDFGTDNTTINQMACAQSLNGTQCECHKSRSAIDSSWSRGIDFWTLTYGVVFCVLLSMLELGRWSYVLIDNSKVNSLVLFSPIGLFVMALSPQVQYCINIEWLDPYSTLLIIYDLLAVGLAAQYCGSLGQSFDDPVIICVLVSSGLDVAMRLVEVYAINLHNFHTQHPGYVQQV